MKLDEVLEQISGRVAIGGHINPDGDCMGSCLALANYIWDNYPKIAVDVYADPFEEKLAPLPGSQNVLFEAQENREYEVYFAMDCSNKARLAAAQSCFDRARRTIGIDHHISNENYTDVLVLDANASSAAEVLYGLLNPDKISKATAICLYTGILYDSGAFRFSNVSPRTMRIAANLMEKGVEHVPIINRFCETTLQQQRLIGLAFARVQMYYDGKLAFVYLSDKDYQDCGVAFNEEVNIVGLLRDTKGVECAAFLRDNKDGGYRLSTRSRLYVDVNAVCARFGGGGHMRASGARIKNKSVEEIASVIVAAVGEQISAGDGEE